MERKINYPKCPHLQYPPTKGKESRTFTYSDHIYKNDPLIGHFFIYCWPSTPLDETIFD